MGKGEFSLFRSLGCREGKARPKVFFSFLPSFIPQMFLSTYYVPTAGGSDDTSIGLYQDISQYLQIFLLGEELAIPVIIPVFHRK